MIINPAEVRACIINVMLTGETAPLTVMYRVNKEHGVPAFTFELTVNAMVNDRTIRYVSCGGRSKRDVITLRR